MPLKLNIGLSRKVGEANYSSRGASVNVELEVDSSLVAEPAKLQERIRQVFGLVRTSLAEELNGNKGHANVAKSATADDRQKSTGNGQGGSNGQKPAAPRAATESQVKALYAITKSQGSNLNQLLRERFRVGKPEQLSIHEASQLIDDLKSSGSQERG